MGVAVTRLRAIAGRLALGFVGGGLLLGLNAAPLIRYVPEPEPERESEAPMGVRGRRGERVTVPGVSRQPTV